MKNLLLVSLVLSIFSACAQEEKPEIMSKEIQIKTAVLPAPEEKKEGAMVYGYNEDGEVIVLREGTNDLVCVADNPYNKGIQASCYFKELEPFMKRGRQLQKEGKETMEVRKIRGEEVAAGTLKMPETPSMMYIFYGSEETYDKTKATLGDGQFRYVIYTPFATAESTGLPLKPHAKGMPWLMDPGTHRAHIMVGPN
ncbi:hypothetical protein [Maribacter sp. 2308TA10-17]|uniref:hypothetical protein n=1 Tax=Maribacter sp. 2308TA10-17 TaxID=3386276 RepID=UPI0039BCDC8B